MYFSEGGLGKIENSFNVLNKASNIWTSDFYNSDALQLSGRLKLVQIILLRMLRSKCRSTLILLMTFWNDNIKVLGWHSGRDTSLVRENLVLSDDLIKVEFPPWKIWKAGVSSVSPSSKRATKGWRSKRYFSKPFTVVIWPIWNRLIKPNFHVLRVRFCRPQPQCFTSLFWR